MNHLYFNFYGVWAQVSSCNRELLQRIELDFSHFHATHPLPKRVHYQFYGEKSSLPRERIPIIPVSFQSLNSMTYDQGSKRFNDYYGKGLSIYDYGEERGEIFSPCLEKLHELLYLMILSRVGKRLDLQGWHRLHAFGIVKNGTALLGIMPMKGGKSTHFLRFIEDPEVAILSDDAPLISRWGRVRAFPIRVGIEASESPPRVEDETAIYRLRRERYGDKILISLRGLSNPIGEEYRRVVLFKGIRHNGPGCRVVRSSRWALGVELFKSQVIGLGLPMILEYFWEAGWADFFRKSFIALSRFLSSALLLLRSRAYTVFLETDPKENVRVISEQLLRG